jgi:hypothetical protein
VCTLCELLAEYKTFLPELFKDIDRQLTPLGLLSIHALLGGPVEQIQACTLATAYPHWLPKWISLPHRFGTSPNAAQY